MYKAILLVAMVAFLFVNTNVNAAACENSNRSSVCELMTGEKLLKDIEKFFEGNPLEVSRIMAEAQYPTKVWMELEAEIKNSGGKYAMELGEDEYGFNIVVVWRKW